MKLCGFIRLSNYSGYLNIGVLFSPLRYTTAYSEHHRLRKDKFQVSR